MYMDLSIYRSIDLSTKKMLRPWSQQARQLTPHRRRVAHLENRRVGFIFIETKKQSLNTGARANNTLHK